MNSEYVSREKQKNRHALFDKAERICYGISGNFSEDSVSVTEALQEVKPEMQDQTECYKEKEMPEE